MLISIENNIMNIDRHIHLKVSHVNYFSSIKTQRQQYKCIIIDRANYQFTLMKSWQIIM